MIAKRGPRTHHFNAAPQALKGGFDQLLGLQTGLAGIKHAACVTIPPVKDYGNVDIDDIAVDQNLFAGNAMAQT